VNAFKRGEASGGVVYCITCTWCGQSWQRRTVRAGQRPRCPACGSLGRFRFGPASPDFGFIERVEVALDCEPPGGREL
jgi:NAD-dependent SIR2 family protein deacetylase